MDWRGIHVFRAIDDSSLRHLGGWVGGHFKTFAQMAPLFLAGSARRRKLLRCLLATSTLFKLIYRKPRKLRCERYVQLVSETVDQLLICTRDACSLAFSKYKIHLLLHVPQHLHLFASLPDVSTEVEESMNGTFRTLYAASSGRKKVESLFLAKKMTERDSYTHFRSGGYVPDEETGLLFHISSDIQALLASRTIESGKKSSSSSNPSHSVTVGDYVYGNVNGHSIYGLCAKLQNNLATLVPYCLVQVLNGFLLDELGNLSLTKQGDAKDLEELRLTIAVETLTVLHVYKAPDSILAS